MSYQMKTMIGIIEENYGAVAEPVWFVFLSSSNLQSVLTIVQAQER